MTTTKNKSGLNGPRIQEIRESQKMSREFLAGRCLTTVDRMGRIEAGTYGSYVGIDTALAIARALEVKLEDIVDNGEDGK